MMTMSAKRIVYAEGSLKPPCFSAGASVEVSDIRISFSHDRSGIYRDVVPPRPLGVRDLEAEEAVEDVEQRAEQVEEAEGEVGDRRDAEHPGDVGAAGVPRHEHRGDRPGVLDRTAEDLRR